MKKLFFGLRTSLKPFGTLSAFKMEVNLPYTLPKFVNNYLSDKVHLLFTNLNASKIPYTFDGKKQVGQFYYCPGIGSINLGVSFCNTAGMLSLSVYADEKHIKNPQEVVDILLK